MSDKNLSVPTRLLFGLLVFLALLCAFWYADFIFGRKLTVFSSFSLLGFIFCLLSAIFFAVIAIKGIFKATVHPPLLGSIAVMAGFFALATFIFMFVVPTARESETLEGKSIFGLQLMLIAFSLLFALAFAINLIILYRSQSRIYKKLSELKK